MTGREYQRLAMVTKNNSLTADQQLDNAAMGLNGEAGEVIDIVKKARFQGHKLDRAKLIDELGDVMWYAALLCEALDTDIDSVMTFNISKLKTRYPQGFDADKSVNRKL